MFIGDIDGNQLQPKQVKNKYKALYGNSVAKK